MWHSKNEAIDLTRNVQHDNCCQAPVSHSITLSSLWHPERSDIAYNVTLSDHTTANGFHGNPI